MGEDNHDSKPVLAYAGTDKVNQKYLERVSQFTSSASLASLSLSLSLSPLSLSLSQVNHFSSSPKQGRVRLTALLFTATLRIHRCCTARTTAVALYLSFPPISLLKLLQLGQLCVLKRQQPQRLTFRRRRSAAWPYNFSLSLSH